jgi:regulator of nucleoside diphosphate kinase
MGSMLIGLSEGDEMSWPLPSEETFRLVIKEVVEQPERSGNFDL